jgi:hypothetical protein
MDRSGSSGFDVSRMSTAEKLLAGGSILLLIDSFFPWQSIDLGGLEDLIGRGISANMWQGSGAFAGIIAGLLAIALIVVGVLSMTGSMANMGTMPADKLVGWIGAGVFVFGILKFVFVVANSPGWAAFVGLVLLLAIGYGAWQKIQTSGGFTMGGTSGGTMGGGTMGGGTMGGGTMGGGTPPSSAPPPGPPPAPPPTDT